MKSCIISCIPSPCICTLFFQVCLVLESKPSLHVSNIKRKVLQISKCDLNSNQKLFASFQTKIKRKQNKEKEKELEKVKGPRGNGSASLPNRPIAQQDTNPKGYLASPSAR
jgi:hypothetical protein